MTRSLRQLRRPRRSPAPSVPATPEGTPALPAWRAFLVQFSVDGAGDMAVFSGRVEHLNSGRRVRFGSREDLLAALTRLLNTIDNPERHD